ncbi:protein FAR1-RELATED SEQUENCE 7-like [Helianthus annuus]|uniref:protein FAR1-RELATED SEQUENCE 7-like n=1 Tax=Helianthus annuus TaxID=4232 RepID=UPI0016532D92|nr:protein FAR1-RELATED SEQUENCE 7-like [Helianthus annuus]
MVINRLTDKKQYLVDFSFEYSVDDDKRLTGLFWADGLCKRNFMEFGDVISFDATFKTNRRMRDIVWTDSIDPEEFERQWKLVMIEYGLTQTKWIDDMFAMRSMWIPAFYRHEPMSGLMRTTSRSEKFMNHFDGAMDVQRFNHRKNDHISRYTEPNDWSQTTLEKDAAKIYTRSIFFDQQIEIYETITECLLMDTKIEGPQIRISLKDFKAHRDGLLEVCFKNLENDVTAQCSCLRFEQYGLLCKNIYFPFKMFGVKEIPNKYVMKRWTKDVVSNELNATFDVKVNDKDEQQKAKQIAREIIYTGEYLVSNLISDLDQLVLVRDQMKQIKEKVDQSRITNQLDPKFDRFSKLIGYQQPVTNARPTVPVPAGHDIRTCEILKGKQQNKMKGVKIEKDPRHNANEVEDDEEEDEFEDYSGSSDDGT